MQEPFFFRNIRFSLRILSRKLGLTLTVSAYAGVGIRRQPRPSVPVPTYAHESGFAAFPPNRIDG